MAKRTGGTLGSMSVADLKREIARRQRGAETLERRRARIMKKIAALDAQIADLGGTPLPRGDGRGNWRNKVSLPDALVAALRGKTMGVTDAAEAVLKAGYKTTARTFKIMVNAALLNDKRIKRVARGQYTLKT